jgi:anti-sigma B factor antagonist
MTVESVDSSTLLRFAGEIDIATAERLRSLLESAIDDQGKVLVDLSGVTFIDSFGLRVLVSIHGVVPPGSGAFDIVDASPQVRRTFTVTGLDLAYRWPSERN